MSALSGRHLFACCWFCAEAQHGPLRGYQLVRHWSEHLFAVVKWICLSLHAVPALSLCDVGSVLFCCSFSTLSVCEKQSQACRVTQMEIFVSFEQSIQWNAKCEMSAVNDRSLCTFVSLQYTFSKCGMRHACYFVSACHASFRLEVRTRQCWRRNFSIFMDTCRLLPSEVLKPSK